MNNSTIKIIDEAIELELNMSKLYGFFSEYIEHDRSFWYRLGIEEKNHAALLKTAKDFISFARFPQGLMPEDLQMLQESNSKVLETINRFLENPDRELAFKMALELEKSAGEIHFQRFMDKRSRDNISDIFQKLNQADKDHAERISMYMKECGLSGE